MALVSPRGSRPGRAQAELFHARERRRAAQRQRAFDADAATPFDMGTVAAGNPLPTPYPMRAASRLAVSFSAPLTAGQLTVSIGARTLGTPALTADEIRRLEFGERNEDVVPQSAIAGTVTLYVLDEWARPRAVATGTFT